jgi:hypothetical protein
LQDSGAKNAKGRSIAFSGLLTHEANTFLGINRSKLSAFAFFVAKNLCGLGLVAALPRCAFCGQAFCTI